MLHQPYSPLLVLASVVVASLAIPLDAWDVIATDGWAWAIAVGVIVITAVALLAGRLDRTLSTERSRTEAILEAALDAVITIDRRGRVLEFNPAAERLFGYTRDEAVGRDMASLIVPEHLHAAHRAGLEHYRPDRPDSILGKRLEMPALRSDGTELVVELAITRISAGEPLEFTGFLRDITERTRAEEAFRLHARELERLTREAEAAKVAAEAANRTKANFLAAMSHDLRTPLNAIGGYVELMEMGIRGPVSDLQRDDLDRIKQNQKLLLALVTDVLNFAQVEAGRLAIKEEAIDVADLLASLEPMFSVQLAAKGLTHEFVPWDGYALGDRERVQQVLLNLLTNAIKFTPAGGRIRVEASCREDRVCVDVGDTGVGIKAELLESIFDPFVQAGSRGTVAAGETGVGLGLAISRELARMMGADLSVESAEGQGSVFTLSLRRVDPDVTAVDLETA